MSSSSDKNEIRIGRVNKYKDQEEKSKLLEQLYVHDVYDRIAVDFEHEHHQPWPQVKQFLLNMEAGSLVADIGCGNGRYLNVNPNITVVGVDRSCNLLTSANQRVSGVTCRGDCLSLPFREGLFDAVLFIGVIHHLVSCRRQAKALQELSRITRPNGTILLCTWAWEQQKRKFNGQNLLVPRHVATQGEGVDPSHALRCNCHLPSEQLNQTTEELDQKIQPKSFNSNVLGKLEQLFLGTSSLFYKLLKRKHSLDSLREDCCSSHSTDSGHSNEGSDERTNDNRELPIDRPIRVPVEFKVREFPASSLFSINRSRSSEVSVHSRDCRSHTSSPCHSRDDRFYHVFKQGELERLVRDNTKDLVVTSCAYSSGHWCATLTKTV